MNAHRVRLAAKATELAFVSPQVIGLRIAQIAMAGLPPTGRDLAELHRMGNEKFIVFFESWNAMAMQTLRANQALTISLWRWYVSSWITGRSNARQAPPPTFWALKLLSSGMTPIHRRVIANAKRLGGRRA